MHDDDDDDDEESSGLRESKLIRFNPDKILKSAHLLWEENPVWPTTLVTSCHTGNGLCIMGWRRSAPVGSVWRSAALEDSERETGPSVHHTTHINQHYHQLFLKLTSYYISSLTAVNKKMGFFHYLAFMNAVFGQKYK